MVLSAFLFNNTLNLFSIQVCKYKHVAGETYNLKPYTLLCTLQGQGGNSSRALNLSKDCSIND